MSLTASAPGRSEQLRIIYLGQMENSSLKYEMIEEGQAAGMSIQRREL
jgi:hypothetical protein